MSSRKTRESKANAPNKSITKRINFWQMCRDVLIASMSKGQFPIALVGMIVMIAIIKMPASDISKLAFEIFTDIRENLVFSFFVSPLITLAWFFHAKWQRKTLRDEINRVSNEKNELQRKKLGNKITSSN